MITHFGDARLRALHERGDARRLSPSLVRRIGRILDNLDTASAPSAMDYPGYRLHTLKGDFAGFWSVAVSGNWRIIFRFDGADVRDVRLIDYH